MEQQIQITETGGRFLITPITETNIFTREDFTEEQLEIQEMVRGFCTEHIAPVKEELEKKDKDLTFSLLKKQENQDLWVLKFLKNMEVWIQIK